jgi:5-methylcytosine-specific restriction endonuclease McrA
LELHHVNGDGNDNRLENLNLLCGNCHSQTDNWGGRGVEKVKVPNEISSSYGLERLAPLPPAKPRAKWEPGIFSRGRRRTV